MTRLLFVTMSIRLPWACHAADTVKPSVTSILPARAYEIHLKRQRRSNCAGLLYLSSMHKIQESSTGMATYEASAQLLKQLQIRCMPSSGYVRLTADQVQTKFQLGPINCRSAADQVPAMMSGNCRAGLRCTAAGWHLPSRKSARSATPILQRTAQTE